MRLTGIALGTLAAGWCAVAALAATAKPPAAKSGKAAVKPVPKPVASQASAVAPVAPLPANGPKVSAEAVEFFETHVRPVLAEKCYACHGPKIQQSGLR